MLLIVCTDAGIFTGRTVSLIRRISFWQKLWNVVGLFVGSEMQKRGMEEEEEKERKKEVGQGLSCPIRGLCFSVPNVNKARPN